MKPTKRLGFNFMRSYFDVLNQLEKDSDKLGFLLSIINKQFLDKDPEELNFIVNLCYESQRHAIEKSVKGWKTATKTDLQGNPLPPLQGNTPPPKQEEQEQEQEQEQEKEETTTKAEVDFEIFINKIQSHEGDSWRETFYRQTKTSKGSLSKLLNKFIDECKLRDNRHKDLTDFKQHFLNWVNIQDQNNKIDNYKLKPNKSLGV